MSYRESSINKSEPTGKLPPAGPRDLFLDDSGCAANFTQSYQNDNILFTLFFICILFVVQCIYLCSRYIDKLFISVIYLNED